jgi:hypothetical protein
MKQKELKNLAKKIAELEIRMNNATDDDEIQLITNEMIGLSSRVRSFEELDILDEMVQEILEK